MKLQTCILGRLSTNCYIIMNEDNHKAIIIDPADQPYDIMKQLETCNMTPVAILLTHGHFDHTMAVSELVHKYNIPVYASEKEKELIESPSLNCSVMMGLNYTITPTICIKDGQVLDLAGIPIQVIHTPGHTIGGVCYYLNENAMLFSGDTLFLESMGRTDLPTGNSSNLLESIQNKLMKLSDDVIVYPGHGASTSIGYERKNNPYLSDENFWD